MATKRIQAILTLKDDFSKAIAAARTESEKFKEAWEAHGRTIERTGKKIENVGNALSSVLTPAMTAMAAAGVAAYNEMDAGMDSMIAKTGATGKALEANKEVVNDLFRSSAFGYEQIGDAVGYMQSFTDATGNQLQNLSSYALKFSEITGGDMYESILMASRTMEQFNVGANQMPRIFDAMAAAAQNSGIEVSELFDVVQENVPQLKELGMGFEEAFAFAGNIGKAGYQMDRIFDSIKDSQSVLAESGYGLRDGLKMVQEQLDNAASDTERLGIAVQYFGEENAAYMLDALEKGVVNLEDFSSTAESAAGTVSSTYENMKGPMETLQTTWNNLKGTAGEFAAAVIEGAAPALEMASDALQKASAWVNSLDDGQKRLLATVVLVVGGIGPLITIVGGLVTVFGSGYASILTFVGGFGRIITAGSSVIKALGTIGGMLGPGGVIILGIAAVLPMIVELCGGWDNIKAKGVAAFEAVSGWIGTTKNKIGELWQSVKNFVADSALGRLVGKLRDVVSAGSSVGSNATGTAFWRGGLTQVHERGGEILDLPRGTRIYPHDKSVQMAYAAGASGGGNTTVSFAGSTFVVREEADVDKIATRIVKKLQLADKNRG